MRVPRALVLAAAAAAALACAAGGARPYPPPPAGSDDAAAREVLARFARALEAGRFEEAHALLSARWRQAYTPGRLALDWRGSGARGRDAGERVQRGPGWARLPVNDGRTALLVQEPGGWRVDALDEPSAPRPRR